MFNTTPVEEASTKTKNPLWSSVLTVDIDVDEIPSSSSLIGRLEALRQTVAGADLAMPAGMPRDLPKQEYFIGELRSYHLLFSMTLADLVMAQPGVVYWDLVGGGMFMWLDHGALLTLTPSSTNRRHATLVLKGDSFMTNNTDYLEQSMNDLSSYELTNLDR